jgi:hypothetical protein
MHPHDPASFYAILVGIVAELLVAVLWCVALVRFRARFFALFVFATAIFGIFAVVDALLTYDPWTLPTLLGRRAYDTFFHTFVWAQAIALYLFAAGQILLLRWLGTRRSVDDAQV